MERNQINQTKFRYSLHVSVYKNIIIL